MPVPPFIVALRAHVGTSLLWLPGVSAVVLDDASRVLVTRRADTGGWALPSGIPEPGEQMGSACAREVLEETGVQVRVERLLSVLTLPTTRYPNGDVCRFVDHTFACARSPVRPGWPTTSRWRSAGGPVTTCRRCRRTRWSRWPWRCARRLPPSSPDPATPPDPPLTVPTAWHHHLWTPPP